MPRTLRALLLGIAALSPLPMTAGCGGPAASEPSSPAVSPDSDEGRRALAEDEALREQRRAQEDRARKRLRNLPHEG